MSVRDADKPRVREAERQKIESWIAAVEKLPRRQTRVLTWPLEHHQFLSAWVNEKSLSPVGVTADSWNRIGREVNAS